MRTINFILVFFIFFGFSRLSSQPYYKLLKDGRNWVYTQMAPGEDPPVHILLAFALSMQGDTLIQDNYFKKIYQRTLKVNPGSTTIHNPKEILNTYLYALMREDTFERKVYMIPYRDTISMCQPTEHLLYDFFLLEGDTLNDCLLENLYEPSFMSYIPRVDSVRPLTYLGLESIAFFTKGVFVNYGDLADTPGLLLEGYGYEQHGLINYGRKGPLVLFQYFCEGDSLDCELLSAIEEPGIPKSEFSFSPNPANDIVIIRADQNLRRETAMKISVLDASGNVVLRSTWNPQYELKVDVSELNYGLYFFNIFGQRINTTEKLLIFH